MRKKIVLALGGNALGEDLAGQMQAVKITAQAIVDLIAQGHEVIVTHGNGPQVGMINQAFEAAAKTEAHSPMLPMSVCVALSQGYIGYDLQNALREELLSRGMHKPVATLVTQVEVDAHDPAFLNPTKPIGSFFTQQEAEQLEKQGYTLREDAGRGYRRVVASPKPVDIIEKETVKALVEAGQVVITVGGISCWLRESTRSLVIVGWVGTETKSHFTFTSASVLLSARAASSIPVSPTRREFAPREAMFIATFAAPPGRSSMVSTFTTGTGASGEIRLVGPYQ